MNSPSSFEERSSTLFQEWTARFQALDSPVESGVGHADASTLGRTSKLPARLWEVGEKMLCPVVGTCLSIEEVRKIARKYDVIPEGASDYEAHVTVVSYCKKRNALAEAVHLTLDRQHALWVGRFGKIKSEDAAFTMWQAAMERGEAAGAMWGALTCRAATPELRQRVYEDIHMLSHQLGAGARADLKNVETLEKRIEERDGEMRRWKQRTDTELSASAMRIRHLEQRLASAEYRAREVDELRRQLDASDAGRRISLLEHSLAAAEAHAESLALKAERADTLEVRIADLKIENQKMGETQKRAQAERDALERYLDDTSACVNCEQPATCAHPDFIGRRLLCVGGRTNLQVQYRALVERAGGTLIYHDGGREEALSRLPELLGQADAVICPVDCVGHPAYYQLKRHCKQVGKPCVLLRSSGLASFAEGLRRLAEGQSEFAAANSSCSADQAGQIISII